MKEEIIKLHGTDYAVTQCGVCGIWFTVPLEVHQNHQRLGGYAFCPNGHQWGWRMGTEERDALRNERDRLKQDAARLEDELLAEKRRADTAEKRISKARLRALAGVCPCCNRTFANVQRHMLTKHANVVPLAQKATS